eukprot:CAMPEP_0175266182 /NCGR_PEP_ID=MMETSP0093-20121207/43200_1 /TAXON_ID=311494 /ORGANISM="Alexandrium monilatum, Strain CCMP3105" /LENGTH=107 /DNA_ID=CAMNT_0016560777 /DNA_START=21 /DNA_END=342 /DNA_ORIENTATION=-
MPSKATPTQLANSHTSFSSSSSAHVAVPTSCGSFCMASSQARTRHLVTSVATATQVLPGGTTCQGASAARAAGTAAVLRALWRAHQATVQSRAWRPRAAPEAARDPP